MRGDKQTYITPLFEPLSKAGFVWFTIDYRLAPQHRWPACAGDVDAAIRWVKTHAKDYKVDSRRIALIGESAGGHLVSYAGVRATEVTRLAAVVPIYAPHDLEFQVESCPFSLCVHRRGRPTPMSPFGACYRPTSIENLRMALPTRSVEVETTFSMPQPSLPSSSFLAS